MGLLAILWCAIDALGVARASDAVDQTLHVDVTAASCEPDSLTVKAGRVAFFVRNASSQAVEWEILDGIKVVEERENIPPGETKLLKARLSQGDYQITCGLLSNPKGALHVLASDGASPKIAPADLIGPLAEYRVYASGEIDSLLEETRLLAEATAGGDLQAARQRLASAHVHYARVAPIAVFFPDLDGVVDPKADRADLSDPSVLGFRQLERQLTTAGAHDVQAVAAKLFADVSAMRERFAVLPLTPTPTISGVVQTIGGSVAALIEDTSPASACGINDLYNYFLGVRTFVGLFQPLIAKSDSLLSLSLAHDLDAAISILEAYGDGPTPHSGASGLSPTDRAALEALSKRLAENLGRLPIVLGIS